MNRSGFKWQIQKTGWLFGLLTAVVILCDAAYGQTPNLDATFEKPVLLLADGKPIDTGDNWGHSGPCLGDADGDGVLDLVVGDFSGRFHVFRNESSNENPRYASANYLQAGGVDALVPVY